MLIMDELDDSEKNENDEDKAKEAIGDCMFLSRISTAVQRIGSVTHGTVVPILWRKRPSVGHTSM